MHGQRIGYVRVSSFGQNPERQLEHVQVDRLFTDKASEVLDCPLVTIDRKLSRASGPRCEILVPPTAGAR